VSFFRKLFPRFGTTKTVGWQTLMGGDAAATAGNLSRPYQKSAWVRSAIQFVAAPISLRPLLVTADRRGGDVVIEDAALTAFLERPARTASGTMNRQDFLESTVGMLKLKGQCFWLMDESWESARGVKSPLILAKPDSMHAVIDGGQLIGWTYNSGGRKAAMIPEAVIHLKFWNPYDDVLGLSEWEGAMVAAEADYSAGVFARNLARNNGDRGPYVIGKGGVFTDDQVKQVSAQLRAKREMGQRGDFRAAFLPADVEIREPSINAVDSAYVSQRLENRKEIYAAFGVPPSFADPQASYSIGSASDRFRLIEDTCMPLAAKIADALEIVVTRFLGKRQTVFVEFDWDSHSTMQQVRAERFTTATSAVDRGMPWQAASEYFRLKLPRFAGDSIGRVPFNLTEIGGVPSDQSAVISEEGDPLAELEQLFLARTAPAQAGCGCGAKAVQGTGEVSAEWQRIHKAREPWEKKFQAKVSRFLMDARAETLRNIAAQGEGKAVARNFDALALIFDLGSFLSSWISGLTGVSRAALEQAGFEVWNDELGRTDPLTMPAPEVLQAIAARENKIKDAGQDVFDSILAELRDGTVKGDTMDELAERTRRAFAGIDKARGLMIAKTETTVAYETARAIAFRQAGVKWKKWLSSGLGNERLSHLNANQQIVSTSAKFTVGGYLMDFPGDPTAPAKEVINCNCVTVAAEGPDIAGNDDENIPY
jgi:HK97 family phage portal protein